MASSENQLPEAEASLTENPYRLVALDVDGEITLEAFQDALEAQKNGIPVEIFTARDKKSFKLIVLSWLKEKIQTADSLEKLYQIINSVDAFKIETIKQNFEKDYNIEISRICNVRDCMPGCFFGSKTLGSYYDETLRSFESEYCESLKTELYACIENRKVPLPKFALHIKVKRLLTETETSAIEEKCLKHKGDLITLRLIENAENLKSGKEPQILKVNYAGSSPTEKYQIDHAVSIGLHLPQDLEVTNAQCRTLLHHVAAEGDMKRVCQLIVLGANIHARDKDDNSPLDLLKLLLKIRLETIKNLKITLDILRKELEKKQSFDFLEKSLLATLEYTEFGKKYSSFLEEDMSFWRQSPLVSKPAHAFCKSYIDYCAKKLEEDLKNLETEKPLFSEAETYITLPFNRQKRYSGFAAPKKPVAQANHSEQTLYILQEISPRDQMVIPVAILSNTKAKKASDTSTKKSGIARSYYNREDIKLKISNIDFYQDYPERDLRDYPEEGVFYLTDLASHNALNQSGNQSEAKFEASGIERYYFEISAEKGFQIKDPLASHYRHSYFCPYNDEAKLCARFKALREYSSSKKHLEKVQSDIATDYQIAKNYRRLIKEREKNLVQNKEKILRILNADNIKENGLAEKVKQIMQELESKLSKKEYKEKFLDLCQVVLELDELYKTSLFEEVIGFISKVNGFKPTQYCPNANYNPMIQAIVMVTNRFQLTLHACSQEVDKKRPFKALMKNWIVLLRDNKKLQEAFSMAYEDVPTYDELLERELTPLDRLIQFCQFAISFDEEEIKKGHSALLSQTVIRFILYEKNERTRAIALAIHSTLGHISENPSEMARFRKLLEIFVENLYETGISRMTLEQFINRCNRFCSKEKLDIHQADIKIIENSSEKSRGSSPSKFFKESVDNTNPSEKKQLSNGTLFKT